MKYKFLVFIIITLIFVGCSKSDSNDISIYGFDSNEVICEISENGKYVDSCGTEFDSYIDNKHFEIYFNKSKLVSEKDANLILNELENVYYETLIFLDLEENELPLIKLYLYDEAKNLYKSFEYEGIDNYENSNSKYVKSNSIYAINDTNSILSSFVQCALINIAPKEQIPVWILHGISEYLLNDVENINWKYNEYLEMQTLSFEELNNTLNIEDQLAYSIVATFVDNYGQDILKKIVKSYGDITQITNINETDIFDKWKIYLEENSIDNIYGYDNTNVIDLIKEDGQYIDEAGNSFNAYIKSEHFELYYDKNLYKSDDKANNTIEALESIYYDVLGVFLVQEENMPIVKINMYNSDKAYNDQIKALGKKVYNSKGYTKNTNRFYFVYQEDRTVPWWKIFCTHEFVHTVNYCATPKKLINSWFSEGMAMYLSQDKDYFGEYCYDELIKNGFGNYEDLCITGDSAYNYGYSMIQYIVAYYGKEKLTDLINEYGDIEKALDISIDDFEKVWQKFLIGKMENN